MFARSASLCPSQSLSLSLSLSLYVDLKQKLRLKVVYLMVDALMKLGMIGIKEKRQEDLK